MKAPLVILSFLIAVEWGYSQTYYMNIYLKNGTHITYRLTDIHRIDFTNIVSALDAKKSTQIAQSFKLLQNYPNPFNPSTTIQYQIPEAGKVEIKIYDISGRLVRIIENVKHGAGTYQVAWDGLNESGVKVASGLYLYSVKYQNTIHTKKMILIK